MPRGQRWSAQLAVPTEMTSEEDVSLRDLVALVRDLPAAKAAECRRIWSGRVGLFHICIKEEPVTPMWSTREAAWTDAYRRLK